MFQGCENDDTSGFTLYTFPTDENHRKIWIDHSQYSGKITPKTCVCAEHFNDVDKWVAGQRLLLKKNAVPEKFDDHVFEVSELENPVEVENPVSELDYPESPPLTLHRDSNDRYYEVPSGILSFPSLSDNPTIPISPSQFPSPKRNTYATPDDNSEPPTKIPRYIFLSPRRSKKENAVDLDSLLEKKTDEVQTFIRTQLFRTKNHTWKPNERELYMTLFFKGPTSYKHLRRTGFSMPHTSTIKSWFSSISFPTGPSTSILQAVTDKARLMSPIDKKCVLMFDEMYIRKELEYSIKDDLVFGYEDFKDKRKMELANKVMVFMVVGLNSHWKQVDCFFV